MKTKATPKPALSAIPEFKKTAACLKNLEYDSTREPSIADQDRVLIVREILEIAINSKFEEFQYRIGMLEGAQILSRWERTALGKTYDTTLRIAAQIDDLIPEGAAYRRRRNTVTFAEDVAALREIAYWTLGGAKMDEMEQLIFDARNEYEGAVRVLHVINQEHPCLADKLPALPEIPPNPYLKITRPEVAA